MKIALAVLAVLCGAQALPSIKLADNANDLNPAAEGLFVAANLQGWLDLAAQLLVAEDPDMLEVDTWLRGTSSDGYKLWTYMHDFTAEGNDFKTFLDYLSNADTGGNLDIDAFEAWLEAQLDWTTAAKTKATDAGLHDFKALLAQFVALVDQDTFNAFIAQELNDPAIAGLVTEMSSAEAASTVAYLELSPEFQGLLDFLRADDIPIDTIIAAIKAFFGW